MNKQLNPQFAVLIAGRPVSMADTGLAEARAALRRRRDILGPSADMDDVHNLRTRGSDGHVVTGRSYRSPDAEQRTIAYFHAGRRALGDIDGFDTMVRALAVASRSTTVSVDYRFAPEVAVPSSRGRRRDRGALGVEDVSAVTLLGVGGDSAEGNIPAGCALRICEEGGPHLDFQLLVYASFEHDFDTPSFEHGAGTVPRANRT